MMRGFEVDAVLFDMDGTLVRTSDSYTEAIRLTAERLLGERIDEEEIAAIKRIPGFNNDWDATWALIELRRSGQVRHPDAQTRESADYRIMKDIFQTLYLGDRVWSEISQGDAPFVWDDPLIGHEALLFSLDTLLPIAERFPLGIATARPGIEARIAVGRHGLDRYFRPEYIVALEDAPAEKPDPAPLLELARRMGCSQPVYVGDTVNDVLAAHAAGMPCIFVGDQEWLPDGVSPDAHASNPSGVLALLEPVVMGSRQ